MRRRRKLINFSSAWFVKKKYSTELWDRKVRVVKRKMKKKIIFRDIYELMIPREFAPDAHPNYGEIIEKPSLLGHWLY